jgi:diguanylate cyclase (GGDEF)-like protein
VARRTKASIRGTDTLARIGGDEFGLILIGVADRAAAAAVLDKVVEANAVPIRFDNRQIRVTVSVGAALYPADGRSEERLRKRADLAMYAAKKAGGNRCLLFGEINGNGAGVAAT